MKNVDENWSDDPVNQEIKLFLDFFISIPEISDEKAKISGISASVSRSALIFLSQKGWINRVFRRWYQTTFGYEDFSPDDFEGSTPRQLLGRDTGVDHYISLRFSEQTRNYQQIKTEHRIETDVGKNLSRLPIFENQTGIIEIFEKGFTLGPGLKNKLDHNKFLPFDEDFIYFLADVFADAGFLESSMCSDGVEYHWAADFNVKDFMHHPNFLLPIVWKVFLNQSSRKIINALRPEYKNRDSLLVQMSSDLGKLFNYYFALVNTDNFVDYNDLAYSIWQLMREKDPVLIDMGNELKNMSKTKFENKSERIQRSVLIFWVLNKSIDRYLFYPLDRYFGLVEMVWTDKTNLIQDLFFTLHQFIDEQAVDQRKSGREARQTPEIMKDYDKIENAWFSSCTCLRYSKLIKTLATASN